MKTDLSTFALTGKDEALLTCFELALFNEKVISYLKTGAVMEYRSQFYQYFT